MLTKFIQTELEIFSVLVLETTYAVALPTSCSSTKDLNIQTIVGLDNKPSASGNNQTEFLQKFS